MSPETHSPILIVKNRRYKSYQLSAYSDNKANTDEVFVKILLHTYEWLRNRFGDVDVKELDYPDPKEYKEVNVDNFTSFKTSTPYPLEVAYEKDLRMWALQLTEPDAGTQKREPVLGRSFETNIAYSIVGNRILCSFQTVVTEPYDCEASCECFRHGIVRKLVDDADISLHQTIEFINNFHVLENSRDAAFLEDFIASPERSLPILVCSLESSKKRTERAEAQMRKQEISMKRSIADPKFSARAFGLMAEDDGLVDQIPEDVLAFLDEIVRHKIGYAIAFLAQDDALDLLNKTTKLNINENEINIFEPVMFGGNRLSYPKDKINFKSLREIDSFLTNYSAEKDIPFATSFVPEINKIKQDKIAEIVSDREKLASTIDEKIKEYTDPLNVTIANLRNELNNQILLNEQLERKLETVKETSPDASNEIELKERIRLLETELKNANEKIERRNKMDARPTTFSDIAGWVIKEFDDKLILHKKAIALLNEVKPNTCNISLLCDALEYLATDYRDELIGLIDEDEMNVRCTKKYGRPFEVTPLSFLSASSAPVAYKIKYYLGVDGKPHESVLDLHLAIGNRADDLIRIYFLYDKDKKLIVVGSLPKHLPTLSYS